jgi:hypothetical protein
MDFLIPVFTGKAKLQDAAQFVTYPKQSFQNHFRAAGATHGNRMRYDRVLVLLGFRDDGAYELRGHEIIRRRRILPARNSAELF